MFKEEFDLLSDAQKLIGKLLAEEKYAVIATEKNNKYIVQWKENKKYTAFDGKQFFDEAWLTENGELFLIQELSEEHCKNIIRRFIRKNREQVTEEVKRLLNVFDDESYIDVEFVNKDTRVLH